VALAGFYSYHHSFRSGYGDGFYLVSDNSIAPYRCHIRAPSLLNLTALREMIIGWKVADAIIIFGSIDICMGEVDR